MKTIGQRNNVRKGVKLVGDLKFNLRKTTTPEMILENKE